MEKCLHVRTFLLLIVINYSSFFKRQNYFPLISIFGVEVAVIASRVEMFFFLNKKLLLVIVMDSCSFAYWTFRSWPLTVHSGAHTVSVDWCESIRPPLHLFDIKPSFLRTPACFVAQKDALGSLRKFPAWNGQSALLFLKKPDSL